MSKSEKYLVGLGLVIVIAVINIAVRISPQGNPLRTGSVVQGSEYQATTTDATWTTNVPVLIKTGGGALGQVTITTAGTGALTLYDATSTNINNRKGGSLSEATTSITLAKFGITTGLGTFTFDRVFFNGLIVEYIGTNAASSTITWR